MMEESRRGLWWGLVACTALAAACGASHPAPVASASPSTNPAAPPSPAPISCGAEPAGLEPLLHPGALIVFGEVHGTVETPAFVASAACHAARPAWDVVVGMEIPRDLQPQLDRFLASDGKPEDVTALVQGKHWDLQDGTASEALVALIDRIRVLRRAGRKIRLFFFDIPMSDSPEDRDPRMAAAIVAEAARNAGGVTLVLTGDAHAATDSDRWMSWHIAQQHRDLITLDVAYPSGHARVCMMGSGCGILTLRHPKDRGPAPFIELAPADGYSGVFYLGAPATPSSPVRPVGPAEAL